MKYTCTLLAVRDLKTSLQFYHELFGQEVTLDLGDNVLLSGGFALQARFDNLVGAPDFPITYGGNNHEIYFEADDLDAFLATLDARPDITYVHRAKEYPWGQRVVRIYDPDAHIIEIGEAMEAVFKRFQQQGMTLEQIAERTEHPVEYVRQHMG